MEKTVFSSFMLVASGLAFAKVLVLGRVLEKPQYGQYLYLVNLTNYLLPMVSLGLLEGMSKAQPALLAKGRSDDARELRNRCFTAIALICPLTVGCVVLGLAATVGRSWNDGPKILGLMGVELVLSQFFFLLLRDLRSNLKTVQYAVFLCLRGVLDLLLVVLLSRSFGVMGVFMGQSISLASLSILVGWFAMDRLSLKRPDWSSLLSLIKEGAQITVGGVAATTALSVDRLVLGFLLGASDFALYGVHLLVLTAAAIGCNIVFQYSFPRLVQLHAAASDPEQLMVSTRRLFFKILLGGLLAAPVLYLGFLGAAHVFYPRYEIDRILLILLCFTAVVELSNVFPNSLVILGRYRAIIATYTAVATVTVLGVLPAIRAGMGFRWIGVLLLASRVMSLVISSAFLFRAFRSNAGTPAVKSVSAVPQ